MNESDPAMGGVSSSVGSAAPVVIPWARAIRFPGAAGAVPCSSVHPILLESSSRISALIDVLALAGGLLAFEFSAGLVIGILKPEAFPSNGASDEGPPDSGLLLPVLAIRALVTVLIVAVILRKRRQPITSLGVMGKGVFLDTLIGVTAVPFCYLSMMAATLLTFWMFPEMSDQMEENARKIMNLVPRLRPIEFVGFAFLVGFYEELIFRGFWMTRLRRATSSWTISALLTTALFAGLHAFDQTLVAVMNVTILSLLFSALTMLRRSLLPAITAHALFDLSQFLYLLYRAGDSWK